MHTLNKPKSDYAIIVTCNLGYEFGLIACMNAQNYFGTNADWEIGYEDFTDRQREKISNAFSFNVNWTHISDLTPMVKDKRTDPIEPLNRFWISYWLLAYKLLKEKKYKAVCVIQADQFVFSKLDGYFIFAEQGAVVSTEYPFTPIGDDLPYGNDRAIHDRCLCGLFDSVNFIGQDHTDMVLDIVKMQAEDAFKGESNHSVICLNRSIAKHASKARVFPLKANEWMSDHNWHDGKFVVSGDKVFRHDGTQMKAWHNRWWQKGRAFAEVVSMVDSEKELNENRIHNYNFVKDFMCRFNDMTPSIKSECYEHNEIRR